jgi:hypothetical protein
MRHSGSGDQRGRAGRVTPHLPEREPRDKDRGRRDTPPISFARDVGAAARTDSVDANARIDRKVSRASAALCARAFGSRSSNDATSSDRRGGHFGASVVSRGAFSVRDAFTIAAMLAPKNGVRPAIISNATTPSA